MTLFTSHLGRFLLGLPHVCTVRDLSSSPRQLGACFDVLHRRRLSLKGQWIDPVAYASMSKNSGTSRPKHVSYESRKSMRKRPFLE